MKFFTLKIITPEKLVLEELVLQATLPVIRGEVTLLANHIPYIGALKNGGEILIKTEEGEKLLAISGGFIEFHNNVLTILADSADRAEDIDLEMAEAAKARAEELRNQAIINDDEDYAALMAMLEKETYRVKVAKKHYSRRGIYNSL